MSSTDLPSLTIEAPPNEEFASIRTQYDWFLASILMLDTAEEILGTVRATEGLKLEELRGAMARQERALAPPELAEERALLGYVGEILAPLFAAAAAEASAAITDLRSLVRAADSAETLYAIRALAIEHAGLLDDHGLGTLGAEAADQEIEASQRERRLALFSIAALRRKDRGQRATALLLRGSLYRDRGDTDRAVRLFGRAARIAADLDDPNLSFGILGAQGGMHRQLRQFSDAIAIFERMLAEAGDGDSVNALGVQQAIAGCAMEIGHYSRALDAYNAALRLLDALGPHLQVHLVAKRIFLLRQRALVKDFLGRHHLAIADYEHALDIARQAGRRSEEFMLMNDIAAGYMKRGQDRAALRKFQDILRQTERWGNPIMVASARNNVATILLEMGRAAEALDAYRKAFAAKLNSGEQGELIAILGMASALEALGNQKDAETFHALALLPILESGDATALAEHLAHTSSNATPAERVEALKKGLETGGRAMDAARRLLLVLRLCRALDEAGDTFAAVDLCRRNLGPQDAEDALSLGQIELRLFEAKILARATEARPEALRKLSELRARVEAEIDAAELDARRAEIAGRAKPIFSALLEALHMASKAPGDGHDPHTVEAAFELHESAKARTSLTQVAGRQVAAPSNLDARLVTEEQRLIDLVRDLQESDDLPSEAVRLRRLAETRAELDGCRARIAEVAPDYVALRTGKPLALEAMRAALARRLDDNAAVISLYCGEDATHAFIVRADRAEIDWMRLELTHAQCATAVAMLQRTFNGDPNAFPPLPPIDGRRPHTRDLSFLEPIEAAFAPVFAATWDARLLHVVPHGPLHMLPFHALRLPDGRYLAERSALCYWPSLSIGLTRDPATHAPRLRRVFVGAVGARDDPNPGIFAADAALFDDLPCTVTRAIGPGKATRRNFLDAFPQHDVLHISCHGFFDPADPLASGIMVGDGTEAPPVNPWALSPMRRGAFLLTVDDIQRLKLAGQLVTLNACSSGLQGDRNAGDEFDGFSRALLVSGVSSTILTLWNVDQATSVDFMSRLYRRWLGGDGHVALWKAVHAAQRDFMDSDDQRLQHPYHWAPFVLRGDWL